MSELPFWVGALKISPQDYSKWINELPAPEFVLQWAIETGKIDESAYLRWAMAVFQLPMVAPDFLKKAPPIEMWKRHAGGPWNPTALPLYEWNGTLVVGVLEPKNFALENVTLQYVLSPLSQQQHWWRIFAKVKQETLISKSVTTGGSAVGSINPPQFPSSTSENSRIVMPTQVAAPTPPPNPKADVTAGLPPLGGLKLKIKTPEPPPPPPAEASEPSVGENGAKVLKFPGAGMAAVPPPVPIGPETSAKTEEKEEESKVEPKAEKQEGAPTKKPEEETKSEIVLPDAAAMATTISGLPPLGGNTGALKIKKVS